MPLTDLDDPLIKKMMSRAKKRGVVTYEEIIKALPQGKLSSEQIEDLMSQFSEMRVNVVENEDSDDEVDSQDPDMQPIECSRGRKKLPEHPKSNKTVFNLIEENPPEYGAWWILNRDRTIKNHPASGKLTVSFRELHGSGPCSAGKSLFPKVGDDDQLSARDAQAAGCEFDQVFWAAGILSAYSPAAASRLTAFSADCLELLADRVELHRSERGMILNTVLAARDFAAGMCSVHALLREIAIAQQAWMRLVIPENAGIPFPWDKFFTNDHERAPAKFLPPRWEDWANGMAWAAATCLELRPNHSSDNDVRQRRKEHESWLLSQLVHCFQPEGAPAPPVHFDSDPLVGATKLTEVVIPSLKLDGFAFAVLPDDCRRIESIDASYGMGCSLPYSLRSIGSLNLYQCNNSLTMPEGLVEIDAIDVYYSYLKLPDSVGRVGLLALRGADDCLDFVGVREFGEVKLNYAYQTFPECVETIASLRVEESECHLPASLINIGDVFVEDENRDDLAEGVLPRTVHWQEGPVAIGSLELGEEIAMVLPRSIQIVASVKLAPGSHLTLYQDTVIVGGCEIDEGATLERVPVSDRL